MQPSKPDYADHISNS